MKRKGRKRRRKSFQGGGVTPSPGCHQVFPLLTACLAACQHFSTHTKQIQIHITLKNNTKESLANTKAFGSDANSLVGISGIFIGVGEILGKPCISKTVL